MFKGSIVALVTPFKDGRVDLASLDSLIELHLDSGTHGIVPCGTTGESATLTHDEHEEVIARVIRKVDGRVPVIAGTGSNSTREAVRLTRFAAEAGADAALLITPYYNKPSQEGLYQHYRAVAEAVPSLPILLYNVPSRTAVNMTPETVIRLGEVKNIVGIKEASGSIDQTVAILKESDLFVLSGDDSLTLPLMAVGASGVISVTANLLPKDLADLADFMDEGNLQGAREIQFRLARLFEVLFIETNPVPVKTALSLLGKVGPELRPPMCEMHPRNLARLETELRALELL